MVGWCRCGGIGWLLDLIEEHRPALEYDWRARFHLPLTVVGTPEMTFGEACRLVAELAQEPDSHTAAALGGWSHPWSWEAAAVADLWDLTAGIHTAKGAHPTMPRPWPTTTSGTRKGNAGGRTPDEIRAELARMSGRRIGDGK